MAARTVNRGDGVAHKKLRARLAPIVAAGGVRCARCSKLIAPHQLWDLDHCDYDRRQYLGPSHRACNRGVPGRRVVVVKPAKALAFFD